MVKEETDTCVIQESKRGRVATRFGTCPCIVRRHTRARGRECASMCALQLSFASTRVRHAVTPKQTGTVRDKGQGDLIIEHILEAVRHVLENQTRQGCPLDVSLLLGMLLSRSVACSPDVHGANSQARHYTGVLDAT
jgi:hypothetical protein